MRLKNVLTKYSALIGNDTMMIQGAGGNVSWKEGNTLWIKASGTWLAEAEKREIFIPLDLNKTRQLIDAGASELTSACLNTTTLRPSIETSLHALLNQTVVVHIHSVEVIALAVLENARELLAERLEGLNWAWVEYVKPGPDLAKKIAAIISGKEYPDIIVLGNHGLVVAGATIDQVNSLLQTVLIRCKTVPRVVARANNETIDKISDEWRDVGYRLPENHLCHSLGFDLTSLTLARNSWVMYPDHAIFLEGHITLKSKDLLPMEFLKQIHHRPPCIIIEGKGVVVRDDFNRGQAAMLDCYIDVISRLTDASCVIPLNENQIAELLNWDAEKYRQTINSTR
jgi:rhamnose utilization protein RhaD (predicted bifunctional aldolase and dehydrogenase)